MPPSWKSSICCSTGSGARETKTSPGSNSTGRRLTCASRRRGDQVGGAGADRGRARHHPPAKVRLREGDRRVRHRLLVVRAVGRQRGAMRVQRFAEPGDVAVTEDRPHAGEERHSPPSRSTRMRREIADQRLRHRQPDVLLIRTSALPSPRRTPRVDQRLETPRAPRSTSPGVVDRRRRATRAPASWKIVRPTAKPRHRCVAASAKPRASASIGAFKPSSTTPRQYGSRSAISASMRRPLAALSAAAASTTRDRCRGCRAASSRAAGCPAPRGKRFGGTISISSSWPLACTASYSACTCASFSSRLPTSSSGWNGDEALDDLLDRPGDRASVPIERPALEHDRIRSRQLDRPPDPPAAPGRRVERILAVTIVAQETDAPVRACAPFPSRATASTNSFFSAGMRVLVGACRPRELEELVAVVEREQEELGPRRCAARSRGAAASVPRRDRAAECARALAR